MIEALLLDLLMITFTLLALGLARAGQPARAERTLILACAATSACMNVSAADVASPRSVTAYAIAPIALAVVVDRVVTVIRRHVLADLEPLAGLGSGAALDRLRRSASWDRTRLTEVAVRPNVRPIAALVVPAAAAAAIA